jgi:hypothetical protein
MKLIHFDEVKDHENYPHYHLGAVCLDENVMETSKAGFKR